MCNAVYIIGECRIDIALLFRFCDPKVAVAPKMRKSKKRLIYWLHG